MGEVAEDMIDGSCCELCGIYFRQDHGYPVVCLDCWSDLTADERKVHQKAIHKEVS